MSAQGEILSSNKEDKSPPLSENQQVSQKSEIDDDEPQLEEEEADQEQVGQTEHEEEDGNETEGEKP